MMTLQRYTRIAPFASENMLFSIKNTHFIDLYQQSKPIPGFLIEQ